MFSKLWVKILLIIVSVAVLGSITVGIIFSVSKIDKDTYQTNTSDDDNDNKKSSEWYISKETRYYDGEVQAIREYCGEGLVSRLTVDDRYLDFTIGYSGIVEDNYLTIADDIEFQYDNSGKLTKIKSGSESYNVDYDESGSEYKGSVKCNIPLEVHQGYENDSIVSIDLRYSKGGDIKSERYAVHHEGRDGGYVFEEFEKTYIKTYDENGNTVETCYLEDGVVMDRQVNEYNKNGDLAKVLTYYNLSKYYGEIGQEADGPQEPIIDSIYTFEYDSNGALVLVTEYATSENFATDEKDFDFEKADIRDKIKFENDENGRHIKYTRICMASDHEKEYEYNGDGLLVKEFEYLGYDNFRTTVYEYDKNGHCVKKAVNDNEVTVYEWTK